MKLDKRILFLVIPALLILAFDLPVLVTLGYSMAAMLLVAALSHLTRKVIFPYADMGDLLDQASLSSTGAGLVFLGISFIIGMMILGTSVWLAH